MESEDIPCKLFSIDPNFKKKISLSRNHFTCLELPTLHIVLKQMKANCDKILSPLKANSNSSFIPMSSYNGQLYYVYTSSLLHILGLWAKRKWNFKNKSSIPALQDNSSFRRKFLYIFKFLSNICWNILFCLMGTNNLFNTINTHINIHVDIIVCTYNCSVNSDVFLNCTILCVFKV